MTLIDGDKIITALLYNPQNDEYHERKMSIIEFVKMYSDEGLTEEIEKEADEWSGDE